LSLPAAGTQSIASDRSVVLTDDARGGVFGATTAEGAKLEGWLAPHYEDDSMEEEDLAWRSQTAVWEAGEECVPMHEWQTDFHASRLMLFAVLCHVRVDG